MALVLRGFTPPTQRKHDLLESKTALSAVRYLTSLTNEQSSVYRWLNEFYPLLLSHINDTNDPHHIADIDLSNELMSTLLTYLTAAGVDTTVVNSTTFTQENMSAVNVLSLIRDLTLTMELFNVTPGSGSKPDSKDDLVILRLTATNPDGTPDRTIAFAIPNPPPGTYFDSTQNALISEGTIDSGDVVVIATDGTGTQNQYTVQYRAVVSASSEDLTVLTLSAKNPDGTPDTSITFDIPNPPAGTVFNSATNTLVGTGELAAGTVGVVATDSSGVKEFFSVAYNAIAAPPIPVDESITYYTGRDWAMFNNIENPSVETITGDIDTFKNFVSTIVIDPDDLNQTPSVPQFSQLPINAVFYESFWLQRNPLVEPNRIITLNNSPLLTLQLIFHIPNNSTVNTKTLLNLANGNYALMWIREPAYRVALCSISADGVIVELMSVLTDEGHVTLDVDPVSGQVSLYGDLHNTTSAITDWVVFMLTSTNTDGSINTGVTFSIPNPPAGMTFDATTNSLMSNGVVGSGTVTAIATDSNGNSDTLSVDYNSVKATPISQSASIAIPENVQSGWTSISYGVGLGTITDTDIVIQSLTVYQNYLARNRVLSMIPTV